VPAPFLALLMIPLVFERGRCLRNSLTFIAGAITGDDSEMGHPIRLASHPSRKLHRLHLLLDLHSSTGPIAMKITHGTGKSTLAIANVSEVFKSALAGNPTEQAFTMPPSEQAFRVSARFGTATFLCCNTRM
jgi:hypothetical protein